MKRSGPEFAACVMRVPFEDMFKALVENRSAESLPAVHSDGHQVIL